MLSFNFNFLTIRIKNMETYSRERVRDIVTSSFSFLSKPYTTDSSFFRSFRRMIEGYYDEPHRFYHNLEHMCFVVTRVCEYYDSDMYGAANAWKGHCDVVAAFLHDAFYIPGSNYNELYTVDLAVHWMTTFGFSNECIERVKLQIINTNPNEYPRFQQYCDSDTFLVQSADLAGFSDYEMIKENDIKLAKEFASPNLTATQMKGLRNKFLEWLIDREIIYGFKPMRDLYEAKARENINRYLNENKV